MNTRNDATSSTTDPRAGASAPDVAAALEGVPATMLWTLRNRAEEAARPDSYYRDPMSVALYRRIAYPYENFGEPEQSHPVRALVFDGEIRRYLAERRGATVVALGEGLQTTFWRIADPEVRWLSVDLAPAVALRAQVLPAEPRITTLACSALDRSWMDAVTEPERGVFITAEGLFMYLEPAEVWSLITDCAARFEGGALIFDSIPAWVSEQSMTGWELGNRYRTPPMPFHLSPSEAAAIPDRIEGVASATEVPWTGGRGIWSAPADAGAARTPGLPDPPHITLLRFGHAGRPAR